MNITLSVDEQVAQRARVRIANPFAGDLVA